MKSLLASESMALAGALALGSEQIVDVVVATLEPLFATWQADGEMYPDLDRREVARWIHTAALFLLSPPWRYRSHGAKRRSSTSSSSARSSHRSDIRAILSDRRAMRVIS